MINSDKADDEEGLFGGHVASRLRQLTDRQKAIAYVEIDKLLLKIQYPNDAYFNPPQPSHHSNYLPFPLQTMSSGHKIPDANVDY